MDDLSALVARTEGAQPWRKVFHAVNAVLIALLLGLVQPSQRDAALVLGSIALALLALDVARLSAPRVNAAFFRLCNRLASPRELRGLASSTWYALGVFATAVFFGRPEAITGVLVLGLADPAAAYVGRRWGRRPFLGGTVLGSSVFFATCVTVVAVRHGVWISLPVALVASVAERKSWPLDDNFTLPIVSAATLSGLGLMG